MLTERRKYLCTTKGETAVEVAQMDGNAAEKNRFQNSDSDTRGRR